jgi:hypothetical protein
LISLGTAKGNSYYQQSLGLDPITTRGGKGMNTVPQPGSDLVLKNLARLIPDLEALYKDVHAHPELSMQETRTASLAGD